MLGGVLTWWMQQMRDMHPASLRFSDRTRRPSLVIALETLDQSWAELFLDARSGRTILGRLNLGDTGLPEAIAGLSAAQRRSPVLQLPPGLLLQRDTILPLAAEPHLARVVAFEMDRLTPFRADEVLWTCAITQRDTARDQLHVRVTVARRAQIEPVLDALARAGLAPVRIEGANAPGSCRAIPLGTARTDRGWWRRCADAGAMGACAALAATAIALPFILQSIAGAGVDARIDAMRPRVMEAASRRANIASAAAAADAMAAARGQAGAVLQVIALLTDVLPDDTFLTTLNAQQRKLTFSGHSGTAARLIGAMAAQPRLQNPTFTAPVMHDEADGGDSFSIRVELGA